MIDLQTGLIFESKVGDFLINSERVAHVQIGNNLEHALLVLTKTGYTAIPVLDPQYKLHGLISSPYILDAIMGLERIEFEKLEKLRVEDVMKKEIPVLHEDDTLDKGMKLLIDHPFVCAVDDDNNFEGILTRRVILKQLNALVHQLNFKEQQ